MKEADKRPAFEVTLVFSSETAAQALSALAETPAGADNVLSEGSRDRAEPRAIPSSCERRAGVALRFHGGNRAGSVVQRARIPIPSSSFTLPSLRLCGVRHIDVRGLAKLNQPVGVGGWLCENFALYDIGAKGTGKALSGVARHLHSHLSHKVFGMEWTTDPLQGLVSLGRVASFSQSGATAVCGLFPSARHEFVGIQHGLEIALLHSNVHAHRVKLCTLFLDASEEVFLQTHRGIMRDR